MDFRNNEKRRFRLPFVDFASSFAEKEGLLVLHSHLFRTTDWKATKSRSFPRRLLAVLPLDLTVAAAFISNSTRGRPPARFYSICGRRFDDDVRLPLLSADTPQLISRFCFQPSLRVVVHSHVEKMGG